MRAGARRGCLRFGRACDDAAVKLRAALAVAGVLTLALTGCNSSPKPAPPPSQGQGQGQGAPDASPTPFHAPPPKASPAKALTVKSEAFGDGRTIPTQYTCKGDGDPPPLSWSGSVSGAKNLAVVVKDPDAPNGGVIHSVVRGPPGDGPQPGHHPPPHGGEGGG